MSEPPLPASSPPVGAVFGLFLGLNGWVLGLALAVLVARRPELLVSHVLPGALVSSALAWGLWRAWSAALRHRSAHARRVLVGGLCLALGLLLFYLRAFVEPLLVPGGDLDAVLSATASTRRVPLALAWVALAAGVLVLASAGRRRA